MLLDHPTSNNQYEYLNNIIHIFTCCYASFYAETRKLTIGTHTVQNRIRIRLPA